MGLIAGLDEVGMGCIAGPVVVAVLAFDSTKNKIRGITDSKLLTAKKRVQLFSKIIDYCDYIGIGYAAAEDIDRAGIVEAWNIAATKAIGDNIFDTLIVDGIRSVPRYKGSQITVIKGDQIHWQVSAASIVAKVCRDEEMKFFHEFRPQYQWNKNMGYGTKNHYSAITSDGMSFLHRKSFLTSKDS